LRGELERERSRLEQELAAVTAALARQSAVNESLAVNLAKSDELLTDLRGELVAERSRLEQDLAAGQTRLEEELVAERSRLEEERAAERSRLEQELAAAAADLSRHSTVNQALAAKLDKSDELLTALHDELQVERGQWEEDRSTLLQQVADAVTVADALQRAREMREQELAQTLAGQRDKYEGIIAELVTSNNDQQTEYEQLVEELTAIADQQRRRAEYHEAEAARERTAAQQDRADAEARRQELEVRLEAAETICAAHDARHQALRRQLEILASLFTAPLSSEPSQPAEAAVADQTDAQTTRAIA
jgi:chromosome segregation ATPase